MTEFHLAQINIARLKAPQGDPGNAFFFDNLDRINAVADRSAGFVWRLQDESGAATGINAFNDPLLIINMSVWESIEALKAFAFDTVHRKIFERRAEFFAPLDGPHAALWWVKAGDTPTVEDAKAKLELLEQNGPTSTAFTFAARFDPPK